MKFWDKCNVFVPTQFGFRENYSTSLATAHLHELVINELDKNNSICALFLDLAKAFDTVNHNILLFKLEQYGIRGFANDLIRSYLTNRKQFVSGGGFSSSQLSIDIGVPQGSVLGPILFLIYINDLSSCSNFETKLYADDSVLTLSHKDVTTLQTNLDCELPKIELWLQCNQLSLNTSQCSYLLFTKNKKKINFTINNQKINQSDCVKYLGVYLDDRLSWCRHIDYIVTKMSSATGALYKLRPYIPQSALLAVYYSLVYSHLVYGIICWGNTTKMSLSKLQVKQNRIIKLICNNSYQRTKLKPLYTRNFRH